ncbi:MAG: hypothetical protein FJ100_04110 [Deltaproteobacteria bacterium]|nr:hypothetical protein [Deltaproteobacteria bacterium]
MNAARILALAVAVAAVATPVHGETPMVVEPVVLGVDLGNGWMRVGTQSGAALLAHNLWSGAWLRAHGAVARGVQVGLSWWRPAEEGTPPTTRGHAASIDVRYARELASWLHPYGRLGLGAAWVDHERTLGAATFSGSQVLPLGVAALGLDALMSPATWSRSPSARWRFTVGVGYEMGWVQLAGGDWTLQSQRDLSPALTQRDLPLGGATLAGLFQRLSFLVRF